MIRRVKKMTENNDNTDNMIYANADKIFTLAVNS